MKIVECFPPPSANQCGNQQPLKLQVLLDLHLLTADRVRSNINFEICAFEHFLQRSFQETGERKVPDGMIDRFDQKVKDFPPPLSV